VIHCNRGPISKINCECGQKCRFFLISMFSTPVEGLLEFCNTGWATKKLSATMLWKMLMPCAFVWTQYNKTDELKSCVIISMLNRDKNCGWMTVSYVRWVSVCWQTVLDKCVMNEYWVKLWLLLCRLLKLVAGFYPRQSTSSSPAVGSELRKHCSYVRCVIQLVCRCAHERDANLKVLSRVVSNLVAETEAVTASSESLHDVLTPSHCLSALAHSYQ